MRPLRTAIWAAARFRENRKPVRGRRHLRRAKSAPGLRRRILTTATGYASAQIVNVISQVVLPAAFLRGYGVAGYADWLLLSTAVNWISTLDFGLQTYSANQLTLAFQSGAQKDYRILQSVTSRLFLGMSTGVACLILAVASLPWTRLLNTGFGDHATALIVGGLGFQVLGTVLLAYAISIFRALGRPHFESAAGAWYRVCLFIVSWVLVVKRVPLSTIALCLGATAFVATFLATCAVGRLSNAYGVPLTLRFWDQIEARRVLKQSSYFGGFTVGNALIYQTPPLILNAILNKNAVVSFSLTRVMFGLVRQGTAILRNSVIPEITRLAACGDIARLRSLYKAYESAVLSISLIACSIVLMCSERVLHVWTGRRDLFDPALVGFMAAAIVVTAAREYKLDFQYASNNHVSSSIGFLVSYSVFVGLSVPAVMVLGAPGIPLVLLSVESGLMLFLHRQNRELLGRVEFGGILKLGAALPVFLGIATIVSVHLSNGPVAASVVVVGALTGLFLVTCSWLFDLPLIARGRVRMREAA